MTNRTFTDHDGATWQRVSKRRARVLYDAGHTIKIAPALINPVSAWNINADIVQKIQTYNETFDTRINAFEYFNCNSECGKYAAYYIRTEVIK